MKTKKEKAIKLKKAVAYTRVSTWEQASPHCSRGNQQKEIEEYACKNGFTITHYFDDVAPSRNPLIRTAFKAMLKQLKSCRGEITHVIVYSMDRISRNYADTTSVITSLKQQFKTNVISVTGEKNEVILKQLLHSNNATIQTISNEKQKHPTKRKKLHHHRTIPAKAITGKVQSHT